MQTANPLLQELKKHWSFVENQRESGEVSGSFRFFIGVSGGGDSMALLHLCMNFFPREMIRVLHFNHELRGRESDRDEELVRAICRRWGLSCRVGRGNIQARAKETGESLELSARRERYLFFDHCIRDCREAEEEEIFPILITAHHQGDQAETLLLRLFRGAGSRGLGGIRPFSYRQGTGGTYGVFRPLLEVAKEDLLAYDRAHRIPWREDASNGDLLIPRNRIRHELLPLLRSSYQPSLDKTLAQTARILAEEDAYLAEETKQAAAAMVKDLRQIPSTEQVESLLREAQTGNARSLLRRNALFLSGMGIPREDFLAIPVALQRRLLRLVFGAMQRKKEDEEDFLSFSEIEQIRRLFYQSPGKKQVLCGIMFLSDWGGVIACPASVREGTFLQSLRSDIVAVSYEKEPDADQLRSQRCYFYRSREKPAFRTVQPGDKMERFGGGHRALRLLFSEWKLPVPLRREWPVLADDRDILWVALLGRSPKHKLRGGGPVFSIEWRKR